MYTTLSGEVAMQCIADLHKQNAKDRVVHQLQATRKRTARGHRVWERLTFREGSRSVYVSRGLTPTRVHSQL